MACLLNYLLKALSPNTVTFRALVCELGGDREGVEEGSQFNPQQNFFCFQALSHCLCRDHLLDSNHNHSKTQYSKSQIWPATWFCTAHELKMAFASPNDFFFNGKKSIKMLTMGSEIKTID